MYDYKLYSLNASYFKYSLLQEIRWTSSGISHEKSVYPWYDVVRWHFTSVIFFPKPRPWSTHKKKSQKPKLRNLLQNTYITNTPQTCQGHFKKWHWEHVTTQGRLRNFDSWHNLVSWMKFWDRKGAMEKINNVN